MAAHVDLKSLVDLQFKSRGFSFLPHQPIHSLLSGRHSSRMRGRGLDFEELRGYLAGDDIRTMDWRVTARAQRPFVRVFTEERDRPAMVLLDQRINMFFGSRRSTKSVAAAELAALSAWRVLHQGDRVGAVIFDDSSINEIKPQRSRATVMRILELVAKNDGRLSASSEAEASPKILTEALRRVSRLAQHDFTVVVISDFNGTDDATEQALLGLAQHNDVLIAFVFDPLALDLPSVGELVVSDGKLQIELQFGRGRIRQDLLEYSDRRMQRVLAWKNKLNIPVLPINTGEDTAKQIRLLLTQAATARRRV